MLVQPYLIDAAVAIISSSLASNNIAFQFSSGSSAGFNGWTIQTSMDSTFTNYPSVNVICNTFTPMYKENNIGDGRSILTIATAAIKTQTADSLFESVSDMCIEPFFNDNIIGSINGVASKIYIKKISDTRLDINMLDDGWIARQDFEVIVARTS